MKKKAGGEKPKARKAGAQGQQDLAAELTSLRANFVDIISRYQANQEAQLLACIESLSAQPIDDQETLHHDEKQVLAILAELQELRLKPEKGRFKDVRRIDDLIDRIYERLVRTS
jgi:hypothetical protein